MKRWALIVVLITIFILSIGYSLYNKKLIVSGKIAANSNFNVAIDSYDVVADTTVSGANTTITTIDNKINISTDLDSPGSYVIVSASIKNNSNTDVKLQDYVIVGADDSDIKIQVLPTPTIGEIVEAKDSYSFSIKIIWDVDSTVLTKDLDFSIEFLFEQAI